MRSSIVTTILDLAPAETKVIPGEPTFRSLGNDISVIYDYDEVKGGR